MELMAGKTVMPRMGVSLLNRIGEKTNEIRLVKKELG
jgi:hypothetical protein